MQVINSDTDIVYLRNVNKTYDLWLKRSMADGTLLTEEIGGPGGYVNLVNAGHVVLLSNNRTIRFMHDIVHKVRRAATRGGHGARRPRREGLHACMRRPSRSAGTCSGNASSLI